MCYFLTIVTKKFISDNDIKEYSKNYELGIYNNTSEVLSAKQGEFYYTITSGGCSCDLYHGDPGNGHVLINLFTECVGLGELTAFFYLDDGRYSNYITNIHRYIRKTKHISISLDDFFYTFLTEQFDGNNIIYRLTNKIMQCEAIL